MFKDEILKNNDVRKDAATVSLEREATGKFNSLSGSH